jgi:hypothetical protein
MLIAEWRKNRCDVIRVQLDRIKGAVVVEVRVWFDDGFGARPTRKAVILDARHAADLADAFRSVLDRLNELGLGNPGKDQR